ncbi:hypothetical protein EV182_006882, partial [Spiromyces aspiralis]
TGGPLEANKKSGDPIKQKPRWRTIPKKQCSEDSSGSPRRPIRRTIQVGTEVIMWDKPLCAPADVADELDG